MILIARRKLKFFNVACGIVRAVRQLAGVKAYRFVESSQFNGSICLRVVVTLSCSLVPRNIGPAVVVAHCESLLAVDCM